MPFVRLLRYAKCSAGCFILAKVLLQRLLCLPRSLLSINAFSAHRLALASVVVAAKFTDDLFYSNVYYAKVGGVSCRELNGTEHALRRILDW